MTVNEMILEVWQLIGEPTDLDPTDGTADPLPANIDTATNGYTRILTALNQAQISVAMWRQPSGRQFRWRGGIGSSILTVTPTTTTVENTAVAVGDFTVDTALTGSDDDWNGYLIKVGTEIRRVVDSTAAGVLTVGKAFDVAHAVGTTVTYIAQPASLPTDLLEIRTIYDFENDCHIGWNERVSSPIFEYAEGEPSMFWRNSRNLYWDAGYFDATRRYGLEYYRLPVAMSDSQACELPEQFHWAIVLWAAGWGYWRQQDPNERKNLRDEFADFMRTRQTEEMLQWGAQERGLHPRRY